MKSVSESIFNVIVAQYNLRRINGWQIDFVDPDNVIRASIVHGFAFDVYLVDEEYFGNNAETLAITNSILNKF